MLHFSFHRQLRGDCHSAGSIGCGREAAAQHGRVLRQAVPVRPCLRAAHRGQQKGTKKERIKKSKKSKKKQKLAFTLFRPKFAEFPSHLLTNEFFFLSFRRCRFADVAAWPATPNWCASCSTPWVSCGRSRTR
jgi:hypothetical protein